MKKICLPYVYDTETPKGKKGKLSFMPYVVQRSVCDDSVTDAQLCTKLMTLFNRMGYNVTEMMTSRENGSISVVCYSDADQKHKHTKWSFEMVDAKELPRLTD